MHNSILNRFSLEGVSLASNQILIELDRALEKHPVWPKDRVHQAAIVVEEAGELIRAALQEKYELRSFDEVREECIQVAAVALRFLLENQDDGKKVEV